MATPFNSVHWADQVPLNQIDAQIRALQRSIKANEAATHAVFYRLNSRDFSPLHAPYRAWRSTLPDIVETYLAQRRDARSRGAPIGFVPGPVVDVPMAAFLRTEAVYTPAQTRALEAARIELTFHEKMDLERLTDIHVVGHLRTVAAP